MPTDTTPAARGTGARLRRLPLIALGLGALGGSYLLGEVLSLDSLALHRDALLAFRDAHGLATAAGFVAAYAVIVAFSLPGATVATLTGGLLFGVFPGTLFNVLGATAGASALFLAVRAGFGRGLARRIEAGEGRIARIKAGLDANQWESLLLLRLVPVVPFFVANLLPALLAVPFWRFAVTTFLGIIPGAIVYTGVGAGLGEVFAAGGRPDLGVILTPPVLLPLLGLAALAALPILVRRWRARAGR